MPPITKPNNHTFSIKNSERYQLHCILSDNEPCSLVIKDRWNLKKSISTIYLTAEVLSILNCSVSSTADKILNAAVKGLIPSNTNKLHLTQYTFEVRSSCLIFVPNGLPGGLNEEKTSAYLLSTLSVATGLMLLSNPGGWVVAAAAGAFMGMGARGISYTATTEDTQFQAKEFLQQAVTGAIGGMLSGRIASGASVSALLAGGAVSAVGSKTTETLLKDNRLPSGGEIVQQATIGLMSAGVGAGASKIAGQIVGEVSDDIIAHFCKGGVEGAASGMTAQLVDNIGHNLTHEEESDKKDLFDGVREASLQGCVIGGLVAASKQAVKNQNSRSSRAQNTAPLDNTIHEQPESNPKENSLAIPQENSSNPHSSSSASQPNIVLSALDHYMHNGFQPTDVHLKNAPAAIVEQVNQGQVVTLKNHCERIKIYRDGNAIVMKCRNGATTRFNAPINPSTVECPSNKPIQNTAVDNNYALENNKSTTALPIENLQSFCPSLPASSSANGMKVYFFSRPLSGFAGYGSFLSEEARHVGFIIDHPEQGLILFENNGTPGEASSFVAKKIDSFHAQTNASKGRWIYEVGVTDLNLEEIYKLATNWIGQYPDYKWYSDNCRRFANELLRKMITRAEQLDFSINYSDFLNNPCKVIEQLIRSFGFNIPKHLTTAHENTHGILISPG